MCTTKIIQAMITIMYLVPQAYFYNTAVSSKLFVFVSFQNIKQIILQIPGAMSFIHI